MKDVEKTVKENSLAWEMLSEIKKVNKRLVTVILVMFLTFMTVISGIVGGFLWYLNQYDFESTTEITADQDGEGTNIVNGGDLSYGAKSTN